MKKLNLFLASILALFAGVFFSACDKNSIKVDFAQDEIVRSVDEPISLNDLISVKGISKKSIEYKIAKSSAFGFDSETSILTAKESGFSSFVYATYKGNILDGMNVVIKTSFSAPDIQTFVFEEGYLKWNKVADYFENSQTATQANKYLVEGTLTKYALDDPEQLTNTENIRQEVNENKYRLTQSGQYALSVKAIGTGYFADSAKSEVWTKKIGYINSASNLSWNEGVLTWQDESTRANYRVKVSNGTSSTMFDLQQTKTLDLSTYFENATEGAYSILVVSYDKNGELFANESEAIEITKLSTPSVEYVFSESEGGRYKASPLTNGTNIQFDFVKNNETTTISVSPEQEDFYTSFDSLVAGEYQTYAYVVGGQNTFRSDKILLGNTIKLQTPIITGLGENEENGDELNIKVSTAENQVVASKIVTGTQTLEDEIEIGQKEVSTSVRLTQSGSQTLTFMLKPKALSQTEKILNSASSSNFTAKKLGTISGEITHSQTATESTFTFSNVEGAAQYKIFVETALGYELVSTTDYTLTIGETATCEFNQKIQDLFNAVEKDEKLVYSFKIVATADENTTIPSAKTKIIEVLGAPESLEERLSTQKSIEWQEVDGANSYSVQLYTLNKTQYQEYQTNGETTLGSPTTISVETSTLAIANVGYYLAKIYSVSEEVNAYINSEEYLESAFCVAEQLEFDAVEFGYKEEYVAPNEFASATGYFLKVEKPENAYEFAVSIDGNSGSAMKFSETEDYIIYLFASNFEPVGNKTSYEISVVASGEDSNIYLDTDEKIFTISKLDAPTKADITLSEGPGHGKTSNLVLTTIENARLAQIYREGYKQTTLQTGAERATFDMLNTSSANIVFGFKGTEKDANGIYQSDDNIFIDSDEFIVAFTRLDDPTDLAYYDGAITFNSSLAISTTTYQAARYYVLEISDASNPTATPFEVVFDSIAKLVYNGVEVPLGDRANFISTSSNTTTIDIRSLITLVKNSPFAMVYANMPNIAFKLYAWQAKFHTTDNEALLSSNYAITKLDPTSTTLQIQRVPTATLSAQINNDLSVTLSVAGVNVHEDYKNLTSYQLYENNATSGAAQVSGGANINWQINNLTSGVEYNYKVAVSNPYYLESQDSNVVTLYKLSKITSVTIGADGTAAYSLSQTDSERYSRVKVVYDDGTTETTTYSTNGKFDISGIGTYYLTILGGNESNSYVIDGDTTTFVVENMNTLMPATTTLTFANNVLTWNAFAEGQGSLENIFEYVVAFDDGENVVSVSTNTNSLNMISNASVSELASQLSAGTLTIRVYAHLKTYRASISDTIYFGPQITLLDGETTAYNYCAYTDLATIKKLSVPEITNVQFVSSVNGTEPNAGSITPNINIVFEGNYGATGTFEIYINGTKNDSAETISAVSGTYTYTLTANDYNSWLDSGESLVVEIQATSQDDIPSALGRVEIVRANDISEIAFDEKSDGSLDKSVLVTFTNEGTEEAEDYSTSVGGVVFEIKYKAAGETNYTTEYVAQSNVGGAITETLRYDISSLIDTNLSAGGVITIRAFTNSYADDTNQIYYLSSPQYVSTEETTILKRLANANITQNTRGFNIDPSINPNATYVVSYGGQTWEVPKVSDQYFFEYPDEWDPDTYSVDIYAKEDGKINSASVSISLNISRMDKISGFTLTRSAEDAAQTTISWTAPSGATSSTQYLFKVFSASDLTTSIYETTLTGTTFTLSEIFGNDYADLISGNYIRSDFVTDKNFFMQIITIGTGAVANSHAYGFNAKVLGNPVQINQTQENEIINNIYVDDLGYLWFDSEIGQTYIYRLLDEAGAVAQAWKTIEATAERTEIEIDKTNGQYQISDGTFNIEIITIGSATTAGVASSTYGLELDSIKSSTYGADVGFMINNKLEEISINPDNATEILIETISDRAFTKIEVGTSLYAVKTGDVIEFIPDEVGVAETPTNYLYSFSALELADLLRESGLIEDSNSSQTLYFWAYRETESPAASYVISNPYEYAMTFNTLNSYMMVMKPGTEFFTAASVDYRAAGQESADSEDYDNTYALFENNDATDLTDTIGIYVKITQIIEEGQEEPVETTAFFTKAELLSEEYFNSSVFAINIAKIFETEDLVDLTGLFKLQFLTIRTKDGALIISSWLTTDENTEEFVFQRMEAPTEVKISSGNLAWKNNSALSEEYYVYFYGAIKENAEYSIDENSINRCISTREIFDASNQVGDGEAYFIAVQSISKNDRILSSKRIFKSQIVDNQTKAQAVIKNQIKEKLTLADGAIKLKWKDGVDNGMYNLMFEREGSLETIATEFYSNYYQGPFTFKLSDLVNDEIKIRFAFTDISSGVNGIRKTIDFNVKYLLTDFVAYIQSIDSNKDYSQIRDKLSTINTALQDKTVINKFIALIGKETNGVGNQRKLFDSIFERIQTGKYKLEYCLLGGENTLTSNWYSFENTNNENVVCVNAEPPMTVKKENLSNTENVYKLLIKKSQVYTYDNGNYVLANAENYVVKFTQKESFYAFAISSGISGYSMYLSEGFKNTTSSFVYGDGTSIEVYEANEDGEEISNGDYLMIYLNLNDGESVLGKFSEYIGKYTFDVEAYAVGNSASISSKSSLYHITFAGFGADDTMNLEVVNGVFRWTTYMRRDTTVAYKSSLSVVEEVAVVKGGSAKSEFTLKTGAGHYETIKFVNIGEINGNSVVVDSEIYQIKNVYKLNVASLSSKLGTIQIKENASNSSVWSNCYTSSEGLKYKISNDKAQGDYIIVTNENGASQNLYYEVGTTGISTSDGDYEYKSSEIQAEEFEVISLGSNASLKINDAETTTQNYHLRTIYPIDATETLLTTKSVAVSSEASTLEAKMLPEITGLTINNGLLTWNVFENENVSLSGAESVVYRITIEQFMSSYGTSGSSSTSSAEAAYVYTTNTTFDFKDIDIDDDTTSLKATVQVILAKTSQNTPVADYRKTLLEGGYVFENANFTDGTPALMSNGVIKSGIQRLAPIDENSLAVENGKLVWTYSTTGVTENNFSNIYSFIVEDENNNKVRGTFEVVKISGEDKFKITFTEEKGQVSEGTHTFKVYATQGSTNTNSTIKSIPTTIENVEKLAQVTSEDYEINAYEYSNSGNVFRYEILSLDTYFDNYQDAEIEIIFENLQTSLKTTFTLTKDSYQVYIFRDELHQPFFPSANSILLKANDTYKMTMSVSKSGQKILFADTSDEFSLTRTNWEENSISWNETSQQFEWDFDYVKVRAGTEVLETEAVLNGTDTYTIVGQTTDNYTLSDGEEEFVVNKTDVIMPVFVITATYGTTTRTYQTAEKYFKPTIIGPVGVSIVVKFGNTNVESNPATLSEVEEQQIQFNLFASGDGTQNNPYSISTATQLKNIAYRMTKENYLNYYTSNGVEREEVDKKYYFEITNDIDLTDNDNNIETSGNQYINGILFKGEFGGVITGLQDQTKPNSAPTIKYMSKEIAKTKRIINISTGNSCPTNGAIEYGSALFDILSSSAEISNLNISAYFGDKDSAETGISYNALVCGLAITNQGSISDVNLTSFTNKFYLNSGGGYIFYAGIVGANLNQAIISNCQVQTDMIVSGNTTISADIAIAGIAHINSATIENCNVGTDGTNNFSLRAQNLNALDIVQVAGICTTQTTGGTMTNCASYFDIEVSTSGSNMNVVYIARLADYMAGNRTIAEGTGMLGSLAVSEGGDAPETLYMNSLFAYEPQ